MPPSSARTSRLVLLLCANPREAERYVAANEELGPSHDLKEIAAARATQLLIAAELLPDLKNPAFDSEILGHEAQISHCRRAGLVGAEVERALPVLGRQFDYLSSEHLLTAEAA